MTPGVVTPGRFVKKPEGERSERRVHMNRVHVRAGQHGPRTIRPVSPRHWSARGPAGPKAYRFDQAGGLWLIVQALS